MPAWLIPAIGAAVSLISSIWSNKSQKNAQNQMYDKQRKDALADRAFENDFNSPAAQMFRLKAAGLNPNLAYGEGTQTRGVNTRSSDFGSFKPSTPEFSVADGLKMGYDIDQQKQMTDNLKKQNDLLVQQAINTGAQTAKTVADTQNTGLQTETSRFHLDQAKLNASTALEQSKANLEKTYTDMAKTRVDTAFTVNEDQRKALINTQGLQKGYAEIASLRATTAATRQGIRNAEVQEDIAKLDRALKQIGLQPHDPAYIRIASEGLKRIPSPKEFKKWVDGVVGSFFRSADKKISNYRKNLINSAP